MGARADRINRFLLTLLALVLLVLGVLALLAGLGALGSRISEGRLVPPSVTEFATGSNGQWLWPVVAVVLVLLGLLALRWLALQFVTDRVSDLDVTRDRGEGETVLSAKALSDAVTAEVKEYPGVANVSARIVESKRDTWMLLSIKISRRADVDLLRQRLRDEALAHMRQALPDTQLKLQVELEPAPNDDARLLDSATS